MNQELCNRANAFENSLITWGLRSLGTQTHVVHQRSLRVCQTTLTNIQRTLENAS